MKLREYLRTNNLVNNINYQFITMNHDLVTNYLITNFGTKNVSPSKSELEVDSLASEILALYHEKWDYYLDQTLKPLTGTSVLVADNKLEYDKFKGDTTYESSSNKNQDFMGFNSKEFSQLNQNKDTTTSTNSRATDRSQHRVITKTMTDVGKQNDLLKYNNELLASPLLKVICTDISDYITLKYWR